MNIETANRLYEYRKKMGLSQEELAAKIGVSRQAVSKWERAEASPDTDNLIELAKVYGLSLDELLKGKEEAAEPAAEAAEQEAPADGEAFDFKSASTGFNIEDDGDKVHIGFDGIHVLDKDGTRVDIGKGGVFVTENGEQKVYTDEDGVVHKCDGTEEKWHKEKKHFLLTLPYPIIAAIAYILFGTFDVCGGWGYGWIIFLTIPLYYTLIEAILKRDANIFCYPVLMAVVFLILGFAANLWHPGWVVFLTIPIYYAIVNGIKNRKR